MKPLSFALAALLALALKLDAQVTAREYAARRDALAAMLPDAGLEVHDPDQFYFSGKLAEGSAFTIEPGIYVRENLMELLPDTPKNRALIARIRPAFEKYRNIGVRIEDDYLITRDGLEWISRAPREISEIEALMRRPVP